MKIAAAQISCVLGDVVANLAKIRDFCGRAKATGAELIVFPEMADTGYALRAIAKNLGLAIISGISERDGSCIYNTQVCLDAAGEIVAKYRKTHLFTPAPIEEGKCFTAGCELMTHPLGSFRFGLSICYDLRFPEIYRTLAVEQNANVFVISSAWPFPRVEHLRLLATARAVENQSYVVLANRIGTDAGVNFCGNSAIIDPAGAVVAAASSEREELLVTDLSLPLLETVRHQMPVFAHRRPELYLPRPR